MYIWNVFLLDNLRHSNITVATGIARPSVCLSQTVTIHICYISLVHFCLMCPVFSLVFILTIFQHRYCLRRSCSAMALVLSGSLHVVSFNIWFDLFKLQMKR